MANMNNIQFSVIDRVNSTVNNRGSSIYAKMMEAINNLEEGKELRVPVPATHISKVSGFQSNISQNLKRLNCDVSTRKHIEEDGTLVILVSKGKRNRKKNSK